MHLLMTAPYMLSYLKGTALNWFEPLLTSGIEVSWLSDYSEFISELCSRFGPFDPGEAKVELENLHMCDNQRITKCLVEFNRLATRVQWGNAALWRQFYNGLLPWIKDNISRFGKPNNLQDLRTLSQTIDACYLECRSKAARETPVNKSPANQEKSSDKGKTTSNPQAQNPANEKGNSGEKFSTSRSNTANTSTSGTPKPSSDLAPKLGADSRLTQQERQCRINQKLCLFCGKPGHMVKDCNKASTAKACAALVTKDKPSSTATESKKLAATLQLQHWTRVALTSSVSQ